MKSRLFPLGLLCFAGLSACHSNSTSPAPTASVTPAVYVGDLSLEDRQSTAKPREYILKVTFLTDLDLPGLPNENEKGDKLIHTQQVIQEGKIYSDFKPTWDNYNTLACGIDYSTLTKDLSFKVPSGKTVVFDISNTEVGFVNPNDGTSLAEVTLMSSSQENSGQEGVDQLNCRGKPGTLTAKEMIRAFGNDENGHPRIAADIMLKSVYDAQSKLAP